MTGAFGALPGLSIFADFDHFCGLIEGVEIHGWSANKAQSVMPDRVGE
jgi:hypothetical protein